MDMVKSKPLLTFSESDNEIQAERESSPTKKESHSAIISQKFKA
jgi:hypothetical protein